VQYLIIGLGGFLGANARYLVAGWATRRFGVTFPYGTFIINISGSFLLGLLMAFLSGRTSFHPHYLLFFAVGFLGAYTTFSTFSYESLRLIQDGNLVFALIYVLGSTTIGLLGVFLGFRLGGMM
jgi:CrcB protein